MITEDPDSVSGNGLPTLGSSERDQGDRGHGSRSAMRVECSASRYIEAEAFSEGQNTGAT